MRARSEQATKMQTARQKNNNELNETKWKNNNNSNIIIGYNCYYDYNYVYAGHSVRTARFCIRPSTVLCKGTQEEEKNTHAKTNGQQII